MTYSANPVSLSDSTIIIHRTPAEISFTSGPCLLFGLTPSYEEHLVVWNDTGGFLGDIRRAELIDALEQAITWLRRIESITTPTGHINPDTRTYSGDEAPEM